MTPSPHPDEAKEISIVERLPAELVLAIGQYLSGQALAASLRVCQRWNQILCPFRWRHISKSNWHHRRFPLDRFPPIPPTDGSIHPVYSELQNVRSLEWWSNHALTAHDTDLDLKRFLPRRQLPTPDLVRLLGMLSNLTCLSLRTNRYLPYPDIRPLINAVKQLRSLKSLSLVLWSALSSRIPLQDLYPVFEQLEHLHLTGSWCTTNKHHEEYHDHGSIGPPSDGKTWPAMKTLRIRRDALLIVYRCPNLKELELVPADSLYVYRAFTSLLPLTACPQLEKVKICVYLSTGGLKDVGKALSTLKNLKELVLPVRSIEDIGFLWASPQYQWRQQQQDRAFGNNGSSDTEELNGSPPSSSSSYYDLPAPLLECLDISEASTYIDGTQDQQLQALIHHILRTRHRLRHFGIHGFRLQLQHEHAHLGFTDQGMVWACKQLETLQLCLDSQSLDGASPWNLLHALFREIGQMKGLKELSIRVPSMPWDIGLENLCVLATEGARELERLVLSNRGGGLWNREDFEKLVTSVPKLKYLYLKPLDRGFFRKAKTWLSELGREEIELVC